jgi:CDP-diacylglycerol--serine O-phosphatidyltransferase
MNWKSIFPNGVTLLNLGFGVAAIQTNELELAVLFVFIASVCDLLDGLVARALGVSSELGKQLDSLADVVSFGVAPALWIFRTLEPSLGHWAYLSYLIVFAGAYRLARFNISSNQIKGFQGLPIPGNGLFWVSMLYLQQELNFAPWIWVVFILVFAGLMASKLPLIAFKFDQYGWKGNEFRYFTIISSLAGAIWVVVSGKNIVATLPIALILYLVFSAVEQIFKKRHGKV